jgi:hypothetical protein
MKSLFVIQKIKLEQAHHVQPENDDQDTCDLADGGVVLVEGFPDSRCRGAE